MRCAKCFKTLCTVVLSAGLLSAKAQESPNVLRSNFGVYGGLHMSFGSHVQRLGLNLGFFAYHGQVQSNTEIKLYWNYKNLGPDRRHSELVISQGLVLAYGEKRQAESPFYSLTANQTGYANALAYAYNAYFNRIQTSQQTGILALQFGDIFLLSENDLLAKASLDRFRTGAFMLVYQYQSLYQFGLVCNLWTGQMGPGQVPGTANFPVRCYMDSSGGRYTQYSHGLLAAQFKAALPYRQIAQARLGIDAEQLRNAVQNKVMHDMVFLPEKWRPISNCHIPMLCKDGSPYLYEAQQELKEARLYLEAGLNPALFY